MSKKFTSANFLSSKAFQVMCVLLAVDETDTIVKQRLSQGEESSLAGVGF